MSSLVEEIARRFYRGDLATPQQRAEAAFQATRWALQAGATRKDAVQMVLKAIGLTQQNKGAA